jgi:formylglycine-generating enzyme required for sulfatase activity
MFRQIFLSWCLLASLFPLALVLLTASPSPGQDKKPAEKQYMEADLGGGIKMKLVRIESGKFMMGSPKSEKGRDEGEGPQHEVEITKPFYMGVYTVTQAEYEKLMGKNPSYFCRDGAGNEKVAGMDTSRFPVEAVSWEDAMEFCRKLSKKEGKTFDLPTEAEWEYACRAGTTEAFHYGKSLSSKQANFNGNGPYGGADKGPHLKRTTGVGSYEANAFGLYDMHGNVQQWCKDFYKQDYYGESPPRDPQGPAKGALGPVMRGGPWGVIASGCRSARRNGHPPNFRGAYDGFRVVMRLP